VVEDCEIVQRLGDIGPVSAWIALGQVAAARFGRSAGSASQSRRIRYGTPSLSTCWRQAPICAPFNCCSAIAI
jgi:hypothetical protein